MCSNKIINNLSQVSAHLHGDESQVIFLVAPHEERLVFVVVNTTAGRPEPRSVGSLLNIRQTTIITKTVFKVEHELCDRRNRAIEILFKIELQYCRNEWLLCLISLEI